MQRVSFPLTYFSDLNFAALKQELKRQGLVKRLLFSSQ